MGRPASGAAVAWTTALLLAAAACSAPPPPAPPPAVGAARLLPGAGTVPGWEPADEVQRFTGDDLFLFIDGGADLFLEYGFREVAARAYRGPGGAAINAEIYEMADPGAAFGVYSVRCGDAGDDAAVGSAARLADYYLTVWQDRYVATFTGLSETPAVRDGLVAIGRAVAGGIAGRAPAPALATALPAAGQRPHSVRYIRGPVAAANIPLGEAVLPWQAPEAAAARYGGTGGHAPATEVMLYLLAYPDAAAAGHAFRRMTAGSEAAVDAAGGLTFMSPQKQPGRAERRGRHVAVAVGGRRRGSAGAVGESEC
ncbi:MAG TPA: hypothetical protein PLN26_11890 [Acidobacteriota bacterium]|mgnify:CR=1 FL=1|nr:hypothetical protein [Acidobacteriota bacterium]HQG92264.1 hypothetical protein [Acidobacteriota bacterium]